MAKTSCLLLLFVVGAISRMASQSIEISGTITSNVDVENVNVVNITSQTYTITDTYGYFVIKAKLGDTLQFSSLIHKSKKVIIEESIVQLKTLVVNLEEQINELQEVVLGKTLSGDLLHDVTNIDGKPPINFYDVGIPGYTGKPLTQSERRLRQAGEFRPIMLVGLLAGAMPLDPIINSISGRTQMLKSRVFLEKKELLMLRIKDRLAKDFFATSPLEEDLKMDFLFFCAEDEQFLEKCDKKTDFQIFEFLKVKYEEYQNNRSVNRD